MVFVFHNSEMRRLLLAVITLPLAACATVAVGPGRAATQVANADWQYNRALERSDIGTLRELIADTYVFTDPGGRVSGREEVINGFATGRTRIETQTTHNVRIDVFGDAAVETGVLTSKAMRDGRNSGGTFRFTRLWVRQNGRWRTAAIQETALEAQR